MRARRPLRTRASQWEASHHACAAPRAQGDNTPLHWAAMRGHVEVVRALVVAGANKGAVNKQGAAPLDLCDPQARDGGTPPVLPMAHSSQHLRAGQHPAGPHVLRRE